MFSSLSGHFVFQFAVFNRPKTSLYNVLTTSYSHLTVVNETFAVAAQRMLGEVERRMKMKR